MFAALSRSFAAECAANRCYRDWRGFIGTENRMFRGLVSGMFSGAMLPLVLWALPAAGAEPAGDESIQMIVELLRQPDAELRGLALQQVREAMPGEPATLRFAESLPSLSAEGQAALIDALAARRDAAALPAIEKLSNSPDERVQAAVLRAIGSLSGAKAVPRLVEAVADSNSAKSAAARSALVRIPGAEVNQALTKQLGAASPALRIALLDILVERNATSAAADILPLAGDSDAELRRAALAALNKLAGPEQVGGLVALLLKTEQLAEREAVEKAIMFACARGNEAERAAPLLKAYRELPPDARVKVLPALGRVGGPEALSAAEAAMKSDHEELREAGFRALCNWPDASVAAKLLDLAQTGPSDRHRLSALRALIRVAVLADGRSNEERLALLKKAVALATRDEERNLAIDRAKAIRSIESLRFVVPYLDQPAHAQQACATICELAHHKELREPNKAEFDTALDRVIALSKDPKLADRAARYKAGRTIEK